MKKFYLVLSLLALCSCGGGNYYEHGPRYYNGVEYYDDGFYGRHYDHEGGHEHGEHGGGEGHGGGHGGGGHGGGGHR